MKYLTKTLWERNATNGLELHDTLDDAAETIGDDLRAGATSVRLFECQEVEYEEYTYSKTTVQIMGKAK